MLVDNRLAHGLGAFWDEGGGGEMNIGVAADKVEGAQLKHGRRGDQTGSHIGDDHLFNIGFLQGFLLDARLNFLVEKTKGIDQRIDLNDFVFTGWVDHLGRQWGQFLDQMTKKLNQVGLTVRVLLLANQSDQVLRLHDRVKEIVFLSADILLAVFHEQTEVGKGQSHIGQTQFYHNSQEVWLEVGKGRLDLDGMVEVAQPSQDELLRHEILDLVELSDNQWEETHAVVFQKLSIEGLRAFFFSTVKLDDKSLEDLDYGAFEPPLNMFGFLLNFVLSYRNNFVFGLGEEELRQRLSKDLFHSIHPENDIFLCVKVAGIAIANAIEDNFQNDQHDT